VRQLFLGRFQADQEEADDNGKSWLDAAFGQQRDPVVVLVMTA